MKKFIMLLAVVAVAMAGVLVTPNEGSAVPTYARQTGAACFDCHYQHIPKLNSFGRSFKLGGYTDASVDLIEGDGLSTPAVMPIGFITKVRTTSTTAKNSHGEKKGTERTELQFPDEAALFFGGRIGENIGWSMEWAGPWEGFEATTRIVFVNKGDITTGLAVFSAPNAGPASGMSISNTGIYKPIRSFEHRKATVPMQKNGAIPGTAAQGFAFYATGDQFFVNLTLWAPMVQHLDSGFALSTYVRAAYMASVGGGDLFVGVAATGGETKCVECAEKGANATETEQTFKTESTFIDLQWQGELGGAPVEFQVNHFNTPADSNASEADGFGVVFDYSINPEWIAKVAYSTYDDKKKDANIDATSVGILWNIQQNTSLRVEHTSYSGDGASDDSKTTIQLFAAF